MKTNNTYSGTDDRRIMLPKIHKLAGPGARMIEIRPRHFLPEYVLGHLRSQKIVTGVLLNPFKLNEYLSRLENRILLSEIGTSENEPSWLRENEPTVLNLSNAIIGRLASHQKENFSIYKPGIDEKAAFLAMEDMINKQAAPVMPSTKPEAEPVLPGRNTEIPVKPGPEQRTARKPGRPRSAKAKEKAAAPADKISPVLSIAPARYMDLINALEASKRKEPVVPKELNSHFWRIARRFYSEITAGTVTRIEGDNLFSLLSSIHEGIRYSCDPDIDNRANRLSFLAVSLKRLK